MQQQASKSTDNVIKLISGVIANNALYPYDLSNLELKLYIMYTDMSTPYLSSALMTRSTKEGNLKVLNQETNMGEFEFIVSAVDLEKVPLTALSNKSLYFSLQEVRQVGEIYQPILKDQIICPVIE